jgi:hypothetical protein
MAAVGMTLGNRVLQAGLVNGSQQLNMTSIVPDGTTGSLSSLEPFTISFSTTATQTGDFSGFPAALALDALVVNAGSNVGLNFGNAAFGTFTATSGTDSIGVNTRTFDFLGTFTPGTDAHWLGFSGVSQAELIISLNQAGGANQSIGGGATLFAFGREVPQGTPEPGTFAIMLGLGTVLGFGSFRRRRP